MTLSRSFLLGLFAAAAVGAALAIRSRSRPGFDRLLLVLAPPAAYLALTRWFLEWMAAPADDWNGRRLTASIALARGNAIYALPGDGPILSGLNGPFAVLAFLPASWFSDPTSAVIAASFIATCLVGLASGLVIARASGRGWSLAIVLASAFALAALAMKPLRMVLMSVHADAVGVAALIGLGAILAGKWRLRAGTAIALAVVAAWSKTLFLPAALLAPAAVEWAIEGRVRVVRRLALTIAAIGGAYAIFSLLFGVREFFHHIFAFPLESPWSSAGDRRIVAGGVAGHAVAWGAAGMEFLAYAIPFAAAGLVAWKLRRNPPPQARALLVVGALLFPVALAGRAKMGGLENNLGLGLIFLALAVSAWLGVALETGGSRLATAAIVVAVVVPAVLAFAEIRGRTHVRPNPYANPHEAAFEYSLRRRGEIYFPQYPLATLLSEGVLYPSGVALVESTRGRVPVPKEWVDRFLPPRLEHIVLYRFDPDSPPEHYNVADSPPGEMMRRYFPGFTRRTRVPDVPGWVAFGKEN